MRKKRDPIVKRAILAAEGGANLARCIGLRRQAVYQWQRIPAEHVLHVEAITHIPRHELRPDLYPKEGRAWK